MKCAACLCPILLILWVSLTLKCARAAGSTESWKIQFEKEELESRLLVILAHEGPFLSEYIAFCCVRRKHGKSR